MKREIGFFEARSKEAKIEEPKVRYSWGGVPYIEAREILESRKGLLEMQKIADLAKSFGLRK